MRWKKEEQKICTSFEENEWDRQWARREWEREQVADYADLCTCVHCTLHMGINALLIQCATWALIPIQRQLFYIISLSLHFIGTWPFHIANTHHLISILTKRRMLKLELHKCKQQQWLATKQKTEPKQKTHTEQKQNKKLIAKTSGAKQKVFPQSGIYGSTSRAQYIRDDITIFALLSCWLVFLLLLLLSYAKMNSKARSSLHMWSTHSIVSDTEIHITYDFTWPGSIEFNNHVILYADCLIRPSTTLVEVGNRFEKPF